MRSDLIEQGLSLMLYGMGTVFVFLTVLIGSVVLMSYVLQRWFPALKEGVVSSATSSPNAARPATGIPAVTLKVIQAAIEQHRQR